MPFHRWLQPNPQDGTTTLQTMLRASQGIRALREALDRHFANADPSGEPRRPGDRAQYVRIATWNLREFDSPSYGYRSEEAKSYIAEILSHFDLIALQEIRRDLDALDDVRRLLGPAWDYIATDVTEGWSGNDERMAFLFNRYRIGFLGVAGELTLPRGRKVTDPFGERFRVEGGPTLELPEGKTIRSKAGLKTTVLKSGPTKIDEDVEIDLPEGTRLVLPSHTSVRFAKNARVPMNDQDGILIAETSSVTLPDAAEIVLPPDSVVGGAMQFARTPFIASFQTGWLKINLATVHIYFGSGASGLERRKEEIRRLTELLGERAKSDRDSDADAHFIALGDFNIVDREHATMDALVSNGFEIPEALLRVPGSNVKQDKFYDQIALWRGRSRRWKRYTHMRSWRAGVFDFFDVVYRRDEEKTYRPFMRKPDSGETYKNYSTWRTHQMSDHLPMWVELQVHFAEEYLGEVEKAITRGLGEAAER